MNEKDMKMAMLHRAVGQIEGVAFFQSEMARNLLMGAVEDITSGVEAMQSQIMAAEEDRLLATTQISRLMKDKDDLLTENGKLREQVAREMVQDTSSGAARHLPLGGPAGDPSDGFAATSPCAGEALGAEDGCEYCKNRKTLATDGTISFFIDSFGGLAYRTKKQTTILVELKFCPVCGRKL